MKVQVLAYAKLNLALSVRSRRPDGFHEIDSVVQTIDLADRLGIEVRDGDSLHVENDLEDLRGPDLAELAAAALLDTKGATRDVRIRIRKRIPAGAGLGGGSSDAGAVLRVLDRLIPPPLPSEELRRIASSLGSDVPLFLVGGCVHISGRGERVDQCDSVQRETFVVLVPPIHCSTATIYAAWDERHVLRGDDRCVLGRNDLLAPALATHPELRGYEQAVGGLGAAYAGMSGSGSSFYAAFDTNAPAAEAASALERTFPEARVFVCRPTSVGSGYPEEGGAA